MEVVILNGITQTAATGLPKTAEGLNALMQRAYNRICLKRGAFCYDRVLGSRFYMLDASDEHAEERALRYAQAALLPLAGVEAVSVRREGERFIFGLQTMLGTGGDCGERSESVKFEEIYAHMAAEYKTQAGVEPEDAADVSIRLKVLAGELYTVLCAAESLKLNCFPQTAAGEALDLHAEERGLVRKDAVKSVGTLTFSRRTALSYAAEIPAGTVCAASGENAVEYETTEAAVLPAGALTVTAAAQAVLGGRRGNAAKGAVNTLVTPPAGIESVTNDVSFTGGADKEDDKALRTRLLRCFYALPNGSNTETYRRAALMTPGVKSVQVVPRANGVNTVAVYLYGDNGAVTDEVLGKVGETLEKLKEISVDVTVAAAVAVKKPVTVYVKPKDGCAFEDAKASCTAAITAYLNAFEVGEPFVTAGLIHAVMETGVAQNCTVPASVADFTPNAGEIVTAGAVNVLETQ